MIRQLFTVLDEEGRTELRWLLVRLTLGAVLNAALCCMLVPLLTAAFTRDWDTSWFWLGAIVIIAVAHHLVVVTNHRRSGELAAQVLAQLHGRIGSTVESMRLGAVEPGSSATIMRLVTKTALDIANAPAHLLSPVINAIVVPVVVTVYMLTVSWQMGMVLTIGVPFVLLGYRAYLRSIEKFESQWDEGTLVCSTAVLEFTTQQSVIRAFGAIPYRPLTDALDEQDSRARRLVLSSYSATVPLYLAISAVLAGVLAVAAHLASQRDISAAVLVALTVLTVRFIEPLTAVADIAGGIRLAAVGFRRCQDLFAIARAVEPAEPVYPNTYSIDVDDVHFSYRPDAPVIDGVSFRADEGSLTAIVGPSGSGKSTLLKLIARFDDVASGSISIGGEDVRRIGTAGVLDRVSIVFQNPYLFSGTIEENIRLAKPDATEAELAAAASRSRVDEIVDRLPDGWQTLVGEGGSHLSGGERQRVAIARALLKDSPIVLLDEVTSSLDPQNELHVQQAVSELSRERTVIVVAHRLQTVQAADRIVVLDSGRVVAQGTHTELVLEDGIYRTFVDSRALAGEWTLTELSASHTGVMQ
ncbi:ABC transporter ATP-binding protein [Rhodococcus qingshengii]|uniref:ABC transporter ATP-binding protein n=1 Tax=Rhodococcus qingshengii TaxID=334542 RepID=UPI0037CB7F35